MPSSSSPIDDSSNHAKKLLAQFLESAHEDIESEFVEFCRSHPGEADSLMRLRQESLQSEGDGKPREQNAGALESPVGEVESTENTKVEGASFRKGDLLPGEEFDDSFIIRRRIGEGGFGVVYEAEQVHLRRVVALKLVTSLCEDSWARFEAEAQALALVEHTNIARLFDARKTENGVPYIVMELVRGVPIDEFCDRKRLSVAHRVELFIEACLAVACCHEKGLIHGDLHPRNILVAVEGEEAVVKLIDFGLVETLGAPLVEGARSLERTAGVPEYTSPESVSNEFGRNARSDVYALGAVLYRLICGLSHRDTSTGFVDFHSAEQNAISPTKSRYEVHCTNETQKLLIARARDSTPSKLGSQMSKELDAILRCCLASDAQNRYANADYLAEDLRNLLADNPLEALRGDDRYFLHVFKLWTRRNRKLVTSGIGILAGIGLLQTPVGGWVIALFGGRSLDDVGKLLLKFLKVIL